MSVLKFLISFGVKIAKRLVIFGKSFLLRKEILFSFVIISLLGENDQKKDLTSIHRHWKLCESIDNKPS